MSIFRRWLDWVREGLNDPLSLDPAECIEALEKEFDLKFPDTPKFKITTVGECSAFILNLLHESGRCPDAEDVWLRTRRIIAASVDISEDKIFRDTLLTEIGF